MPEAFTESSSSLLLTGVLLLLGLRTPSYQLSMSAGSGEGRRHQVAEYLRDECARGGVTLPGGSLGLNRRTEAQQGKQHE